MSNTTTNDQTVAQTSELVFSMTPELVSEAIKSIGCAVSAVEQDGVVWLHSAAHGIGFQVLWGTAQSPDQYSDFTLNCPLRILGGSLPGDILAGWHRTKRFARVAQHGDFVVLEMDVIAAGGISLGHLEVLLQLWVQMMGQFLVYLRNFQAADAPQSSAQTTVADASAQMAESATAA